MTEYLNLFGTREVREKFQVQFVIAFHEVMTACLGLEGLDSDSYLGSDGAIIRSVFGCGPREVLVQKPSPDQLHMLSLVSQLRLAVARTAP